MNTAQSFERHCTVIIYSNTIIMVNMTSDCVCLSQLNLFCVYLTGLEANWSLVLDAVDIQYTKYMQAV